MARSVSDVLGDMDEHLPFSSGSVPAKAAFAQIYKCTSRALITSGNSCMKLQSTLGTAGAGLCYRQSGQLLLTHLTSAPPCLMLSNQDATPCSEHSCHQAFMRGTRVRWHGECPLAEPGDGGLLAAAGCAWPSPGLNLEMCPAPKLPQGMQDLILCVLSHTVWEGSGHRGLFVVSLFSCPAPCPSRALLMPLEAGLRAQLPPSEKGCFPSTAIIPNASRNSRILAPQPKCSVLFAFLPCCTVRNCSACRSSSLPWAVHSSSGARRAVSLRKPLRDEPRMLWPGEGPGSWSSPGWEAELCTAVLAEGSLVHLRPASWHLLPVLLVSRCGCSPAPDNPCALFHSPVCIPGSSLPHRFSPLGRDKTASCSINTACSVLPVPPPCLQPWESCVFL